MDFEVVNSVQCFELLHRHHLVLLPAHLIKYWESIVQDELFNFISRAKVSYFGLNSNEVYKFGQVLQMLEKA